MNGRRWPAALVLVIVACTAAAWSAVGLGRGHAASIYWGAYVGGGQYDRADAPWDMRSLDQFEATVHKSPSLLEWGQSWYDCSPCGFQGFPRNLLDRARARGAIPVLNWGSSAGQLQGPNQASFRLATITAGRYDGYIRRWALAAKRWGHPFFLRFDWEMNTVTDPWGEAGNRNRPGDFVRMWRHVHEIFTSVGATNVTWVWCPNMIYPGDLPVGRRLYPGDRYVDWVGMDGYNWGFTADRSGAWKSFSQVLGPTYRALTRLAPSKPIMIGETATSADGGDKAPWITDALTTQLPTAFPRVRALVWFNKNADGMDWVLESSSDAGTAFSAAIGSSYYRPGGATDVRSGPIPAP